MADDTSQPAAPPKAVHIGGESLADRLIPHIKKILVTFVAVAVVVSVILVIRWRKEAGHEARTEKLAQAMVVARRPVGPEQITTFPPPPPSKEARFASLKERADATLDALVKSGTAAPPLYKAGLLLDAGRTDEAITEYKKLQADKGFEGVSAREGLGIALETKALADKDPASRQRLLEEALAAFTAMQPDEVGLRRAYALYHQGRLQLTLGKRDAAKASFEKAKELGAQTELPELVERRLATM